MWRDPPRPASLCGLWGHRLAGGCDKARENLSLVSRTQCFPTASGKGVDEQTEGHKDLGSVREVAVHGEQGEGGSGRRKGLPTAGERGPHSEKVSHLASKIRKTERGRSDKGTRCCLPRARRLGRWGGGRSHQHGAFLANPHSGGVGQDYFCEEGYEWTQPGGPGGRDAC